MPDKKDHGHDMGQQHQHPAPDDAPGKEPVKAAVSDPAAGDPDDSGNAPLGQGAQVVLTGDAVAAARGGLHDTIDHNVEARDAAILAGHVVPGTTEEAVKGAISSPAAHSGHPSHHKGEHDG